MDILNPRLVAGLTLTLYLIGLGAAFGLRAWVQYRRTGDTGLRRLPKDAPGAGRLGAALFACSLLLVTVGLVLAVIAPGGRLWPTGPATWVGVALAVAGLAAVLASQAAMGPSWRVGVDPSEKTGLVTSGPFAVTRNPIFSAMGLTLIGIAIMVPSPIILGALAAFVAGVQLQVRAVEEPYLSRVHGGSYRGYAARVGRFVPLLGRWR